MNKTEGFLRDIERLFQQEIPTRVIEKAKISLLDYIAVTLAGSKSMQKKLEKYFELEEPEKGKLL